MWLRAVRGDGQQGLREEVRAKGRCELGKLEWDGHLPPNGPRRLGQQRKAVPQRHMRSPSKDQELRPQDSQTPWSLVFPACAFPPAVFFPGVREDLPPSVVPPAGLMPECVA